MTEPKVTDEKVLRGRAIRGMCDILSFLGRDVDHDEDVAATPERVVRYLQQMCIAEPFVFTTFENKGGHEMVIQQGIPFASLCEHHMLPFIGSATVAYIPGKTIVGLSKLARAVKYCAAGLQTQERVTKAVADMLQQNLQPQGVAVLLKAEHTCMTIRGVRAPGAITTTSYLSGAFMQDARCRSEFLELAR
jgi:GTP cyclohydrolase IA